MRVGEIESPSTGAVFNLADIDMAIDELEIALSDLQKIRNFVEICKASIAGQAEFVPGLKTCRVRGERRRAKIVLPADSWDQAMVRNLWFAFPDLAPQYMKISTIAVMAKEYAKLVAEKGPKKFMTFKKSLMDANKGPVGTPRVEIEPIKENAHGTKDVLLESEEG